MKIRFKKLTLRLTQGTKCHRKIEMENLVALQRPSGVAPCTSVEFSLSKSVANSKSANFTEGSSKCSTASP